MELWNDTFGRLMDSGGDVKQTDGVMGGCGSCQSILFLVDEPKPINLIANSSKTYRISTNS